MFTTYTFVHSDSFLCYVVCHIHFQTIPGCIAHIRVSMIFGIYSTAPSIINFPCSFSTKKKQFKIFKKKSQKILPFFLKHEGRLSLLLLYWQRKIQQNSLQEYPGLLFFCACGGLHVWNIAWWDVIVSCCELKLLNFNFYLHAWFEVVGEFTICGAAQGVNIIREDMAHFP